jgi:hypothetical protein
MEIIMGVYIDIGRATRVLIDQPKRTINLSQRVALQADISHKNGAMGPGWYVIARLIDKTSGKCFLASSAPWPLRTEKFEAIRGAIKGLVEELHKPS